MTRRGDNRVRLGPVSLKLSAGEGEGTTGEKLEAAIIDLLARNDQQKETLQILQTMNERLMIIQAMLLATSAESPKEIQKSLARLNEIAVELQIQQAEKSGLDAPKLSDLKKKFAVHIMHQKDASREHETDKERDDREQAEGEKSKEKEL